MTKLPANYQQFQGIDERITALEVRVSLWEGAMQELLKQRDEARRVAKVLAEAAAENLTPLERQAVETAEGYPETKP